MLSGDHLVHVGEGGDAADDEARKIVVTCGVLNLGWTLAKTEGSSPSLAIEKKMRGCPSWKTKSTAVCAMTEPSATTVFCHFACGATVSSAIVSASPCCAGVHCVSWS